jgi:hypothetical protein
LKAEERKPATGDSCQDSPAQGCGSQYNPHHRAQGIYKSENPTGDSGNQASIVIPTIGLMMLNNFSALCRGGLGGRLKRHYDGFAMVEYCYELPTGNDLTMIGSVSWIGTLGLSANM